MKRILNLLILIFATTTIPTYVYGAENPSTDQIDVGNLEQKYWSAKDDDFTVVQNRTFTKSKKIFLSLLTGRLINDGFLEGTPTSLSIGYFFNERHGISYTSTSFVTRDNSVTKEFFNYGTKPAYNSPISTTSLNYIWSPIYAKVSLLEKRILYLDMSFGIHLGQSVYRIMTENGGVLQKSSHYGIDISQLWFLNRSFALRFDIRNTWSTQNQLKYSIPSNQSEASRIIGATRLQDNSWLLGFNYFFGI